MITNIIFSKDRGCQLHALLSSLEANVSTLFLNEVIYTYSNNKYKEGYEIIKKLHPRVIFIKEDNLKTNILSKMKTHFTSFMVDDMIMFKSFPGIDLPLLGENEAFSLRLGRNISEPHLSYPLSLDGHIYRTDNIKPLIESINFNNPNKLESGLQKFKKNWVVSYLYQCTVSIPHNRVSSKSHCKFSGLYSQEILNDRLLDGYEIDHHNMNFDNINNVHKEIDYKFKAR